MVSINIIKSRRSMLFHGLFVLLLCFASHWFPLFSLLFIFPLFFSLFLLPCLRRALGVHGKQNTT